MSKSRIIILSVASILIAALAAEAVLRVSEPESDTDPLPVRAILKAQSSIRHAPYVPEPDLGAVLMPSGQFRVDTPEYSYTLRTDHAGFPNLEPWPASLDVAVLGNSLITGAGVGHEGQFTTLLQHKLGDRTVLNFGVHGGGTGHELRAYRKYAAPLRPKVVIATLWLTWEIDNTLKFDDWLDDDPRPDFTEYRLSYNEEHAIDAKAASARADTVRGSFREFVNRSRVLRALLQGIKSLRGIREPVEQVVLADGDVLYLSARDQQRLMRGWHRPGTPDIRRTFFEPLEQLQSEVESNGGRFFVVLFPSKEELFAAGALPEILEPVREARTELAARRIPTIDLYPVLQKAGTARPVFFRTDMHLNARGHRIVADVLAQSIARKGVFTPAP
jgi:lysophospholipase L1-like esterase